MLGNIQNKMAHMKNSIHPILFFILLTSFTGLLSAAPITLIATDDNIVNDSSTGTTYDHTSTQLYVKHANSSTRSAYVKFNLSTVIGSIDPSQGATLNLTFKELNGASSGNADETFTFAALENTGSPTNTNWTESTLKYSNRPTGNYIDLGSDYTWSYNAGNDTHSIAISDLTNYIQADNTITILLSGPKLNNTSNNPYWHSSESLTEAYRPSLVVVPEASTLGLLAVGMIAVIGASRRRKVTA